MAVSSLVIAAAGQRAPGCLRFLGILKGHQHEAGALCRQKCIYIATTTLKYCGGGSVSSGLCRAASSSAISASYTSNQYRHAHGPGVTELSVNCGNNLMCLLVGNSKIN